MPGLKGKVTIRVEKDGIKHVFAETDEDLYFAQGYVVASDRLFQLDFIPRVASGRLAEVAGRSALPFDRLFLTLGVPQAARDSLQLMMADPITKTALEAYAAGVNAYIASLKPEQIPLEFRLMNYRPEPWTPLNAALLLKFMAHQLSGFSYDVPLTRSRSRLNDLDFQTLFPLPFEIPDPIIPKERKWSFTGFSLTPPDQAFQANVQAITPEPTPNPGNGSNNWAVMPKKSKTGGAIVSNDIHLDYGLPSLWYEIQLSSPSQNVYGATIPGAPGVVLGFNEKLAWAVTNGGTDVLDWYELRFRDSQKKEYMHDGHWRPVISTEHLVRIKGERPETMTLRRTHFGPLVYEGEEAPLLPWVPKGLAMRWGALDPSNELTALLQLNRARSATECEKAIRHFNTPAQNFVCADSQGHVGIWHQGQFPVRWKGQGRLVSDGTTSSYDWRGWIPREEVPFVLDPDRGFVSSANQAPTSPDYPHYLGWAGENPYRGARINEILRGQTRFAPEEFIAMQRDTAHIPARTLLPRMISLIDRTSLNERQARLLDLLDGWDARFEESSVAATVYAEWWKNLERLIWQDEFPDPKLFLYPRLPQTLSLLLGEPEAKWFDRTDTQARETLRDLVLESLQLTEKNLTESLGERMETWEWARYQPTSFRHLARIPGLGRSNIRTGGQAHAIYANTGTHGPVWKSVIALGPRPKAWAVYPGGQSGNPFHANYDNFIDPWTRGEMKEVLFLTDAESASARITHTAVLEAQ